MPLAIYREVAAHLAQCLGVQVELLPQSSTTFAYGDSQIEGLSLNYPPDRDSPAEMLRNPQQQIEAILAYYAQQYGRWERREY